MGFDDGIKRKEAKNNDLKPDCEKHLAKWKRS